uniref:Efflux RND transporter periplasmic adaptor subunit n=1 Tax=Acidobacterium capsulatum TaxID=33075 RepID=A0A7V4XU47_9BACT
MNRIANILILCIFSASASLLLNGCSHAHPPESSAPATAQASLVQSTAASVPRMIPLTGTVHARETAIISAQALGSIRAVLVQASQHVRAGQLLVSLDATAQQASLARAQAAWQAVEQQQQIAGTQSALAASTLQRYQLLRQQKSVSPQEFDEVQKRAQSAALQVRALDAQRAEAQAAVAGARVALGYMQLRAPFAGVITARMADPGTLATPGMPLLAVDRDGPLQVYASVDESLLPQVHMGMNMLVQIDAAGAAALTGKVAEILPAADPSSRTFLLKLDLPANPAVHAGMYATVQLPSGEQAVVLAPQSAIVQRGSLSYVYALDAHGIAQLRYVTLGRTQAHNVIVLSGLTAGEQLVDHPGERDLAGKRIEAM